MSVADTLRQGADRQTLPLSSHSTYYNTHPHIIYILATFHLSRLSFNFTRILHQELRVLPCPYSYTNQIHRLPTSGVYDSARQPPTTATVTTTPTGPLATQYTPRKTFRRSAICRPARGKRAVRERRTLSPTPSLSLCATRRREPSGPSYEDHRTPHVRNTAHQVHAGCYKPCRPRRHRPTCPARVVSTLTEALRR